MASDHLNQYVIETEIARLRERADRLEIETAAARSAAESSRDERERFEAILNMVDVLIYICSADYTVEYVNGRLCERTGLDPTGHKCYTALHDLDEVCSWCPNQRVFAGETVTWEVVSPKDNRWYQAVNMPFTNRDGTLSKMSVIRDITDTKQTEHELRQSREHLESRVQERTAALMSINEQLVSEIADRKSAQREARDAEARYRALVERIPAVIYTSDPYDTGKSMYVSPQVETVFGYTQEEWLADADLRTSLLHPDDKDQVSRDLKHSRSEKQPFVSEHRMITKRGDTVWIHDEALFVTDESGQPICVQGVMLDITRRKDAEEALKRSEERFRAVIEGARDCIFIKDSTLKYTQVNGAMENLLGMRASEIIGATDDIIFGREAGKHILEVELRALDGEAIEEEHKRPVGGVMLTFHDIRVPLRSPDGTVVGVCGISRNITERRSGEPAQVFTASSYPSDAMQAVLEKAGFAAATDSIVLLMGESGSGKDYLARWIHDHSPRSTGPFFAINCAALVQELAESELFGHEPGSFTGARGRKRGLLELAEGGTLLLNEIGELSAPLQAKLLSFLDTRAFMRVGGTKSVRVNARLIAATHRNLEAEVAAGRFLQPLFFRLNVLSVRVPPLRERAADIPYLVHEILGRLEQEMQLSERPVAAPETLEAFARYHWPGNVRELRNVLERAVMLSGTPVIEPSVTSLPVDDRDWSYEVCFPTESTLREVLDEVTRSVCREAILRTNGSKKAAAEALGISRDTLYRYLKRFGLLE
jgi:PAS domain S-box-containing protein